MVECWDGLVSSEAVPDGERESACCINKRRDISKACIKPTDIVD